MGDGNGHEADVGRHNIADAVPEHDLPFVHALGLAQQHIVRPDLFQQLVADHVGIVPQVADHHHKQGQNQMDDPVSKVVGLAGGVGPGAGEPPQLHAENKDQHQGKPEFRDTAGNGADFAQELVQPPVLIPGAQNAQKQGAYKNQDKAHAAQNQGVVDAFGDDLGHRLLVLIGDAKLALQGAPEPADILGGDGVIEPQLFPGPVLFFHAHFLRPLPVVGL